ncbi:EAL domain-containing protein [Sphingomonas sp. HT-1]|uniref:EAL domain-containing protein n=1 Tax=unclassified Sphingomonas TaxID=196159 RepID=UPI0002F6FD12|nr:MULTISPECIES: EAL domain-containing protein [unclassified Sphingomonas]KTF68735.1 diguanylate phosphodiesterase [Sphingomonas sp. WG]
MRDMADIRIGLEPIATHGTREPFAWRAAILSRPQAFHTADAILLAPDRLALEALRLDRALEAAAAADLADSGCLLVVPVNARAGAPDRLLCLLFRAALRHGYPFEQLVIEVHADEDADHAAATALIRACADRGLMVALAGFAAGPLGLRLLAHCSPRLIRLDPGFARRLDAAPARARMVEGVLRIARGMGVAVVAPAPTLDTERDAALASGLRHFHGRGEPAPRRTRPVARPVWNAAVANHRATRLSA